MILVDYNQVTISNITMQIKMNKGVLDEGMIRHMILNSIRMYRTKFKDKYGEIVICADATNYWRKDFFPNYKAHRKHDQEESDLDWNELFRILNKIRDEIAENFPYKVLRVDRAEADDIIGTLCNEFGRDLGGDPILIVSGDHDFKQLQKYSNVSQYAPVGKKFIKHSNPEEYLKEHIIRGDKGDGVPNFLSEDNSFVDNIKQKSIMKKKLAGWLKQKPEEYCDEKMLRNWKRNEQMVDLSKIPENITGAIMDQFNNTKEGNRSKLFNYFVKNKLKNLMQQIQEY